MKHVILFVLIGLFSVPAHAAEESTYDRVMRTGVIRCGYFAWPPFLAIDPNTGAMSGLSYDYVERVGAELDLEIEWMAEIGVGEYTEGLNTGKFDVMCMSVWPDAGRLRNSLLTDPIFYSAVYAVTRKDDKRFQSLKDLNKPDVQISVIDGDISASIARNKFPLAKPFALPQMADLGQQMQAMVTGKADVTFADLGSLKDFAKTNPDTIQVLDHLGPVQVFPEVLAVKKGEVELKMLLDSVITVLSSNRYVLDFLESTESSSYPPIQPYEAP